MPKQTDYGLPLTQVSNATLPWQTVSLVAVALLAYLALGPAPEAWVYDRTAIADGEVWRLVTAHWVHSGPAHALWNIAALILLGLLFERSMQLFLLMALVAGTVAVDVWLWWGNPELAYYCGLSGILNSLLFVGLVRFWCVYKHPLILFVAVVAIAKIVGEIYIGQGLLTQTSWPSVPAAHAAGLVGALGLLILSRVRRLFAQ